MELQNYMNIVSDNSKVIQYFGLSDFKSSMYLRELNAYTIQRKDANIFI